MLGFHAEDPRAQHGSQGQGDEERDQDGCRHRDPELEEELTDHALHVGHRDEDRGDGEGGGHGGESDLPGAAAGRRSSGFSPSSWWR